MACEIHVDDIGTTFRLTIVDCDDVLIDISTATVKDIIFKKPDGTKVTKSGVFYTNGTDGIIDYVTIADDLDLAGTGWHVQAFVTLTTGTWSSEIGDFTVVDNL